MWPIGDYNRLKQELSDRECSDIPITFGILIGDYRQTRCREYVLNYIERFNEESGYWINFYLPGYIDDDNFSNENKLTIKNKNYYFDEKLYDVFLKELASNFGIAYSYNPVLVLVECQNGKLGESRKIIIDLDRNGSDIQNTGNLFDDIFEISQEVVNLDDFSKKLKINNFNSGIFDKVIDSVGSNALKNVKLALKENNRYKIDSK